jgi:SAM-dependent methyltransferase
VIGTCAEAQGVEIIHGDLDSAFAQLAGQQFDGVLISSVLHLFPDPVKVLQCASSLLANGGVVVASLPNLVRLPFVWRQLRYPSRYAGLKDYQRSGMHAISRKAARTWFRASGLKIVKLANAVPANWRRAVALSGGLVSPLFASEYILAGRKKAPQDKVEKDKSGCNKISPNSTQRRGAGISGNASVGSPAERYIDRIAGVLSRK